MLKDFPSEFAALLNRRGRAILNGRASSLTIGLKRAGKRYVSFPNVIESNKVVDCIQLLRRSMYPKMRRVDVPIPREALTEMRKDYSELLPKAMLLKSAPLVSKAARDTRAAVEIGLLAMLRSASMYEFAQRVSGLHLDRDIGCQVLCYEHGDYVGPHNDHQPESDPMMRGYVDVQVTLTSRDVEHQYLVYEVAGHLSHSVFIAEPSLISVYWLPFWHYVTPLVASHKRERTAQRWLLLSSFEIDSGAATTKALK